MPIDGWQSALLFTQDTSTTLQIYMKFAAYFRGPLMTMMYFFSSSTTTNEDVGEVCDVNVTLRRWKKVGHRNTFLISPPFLALGLTGGLMAQLHPHFLQWSFAFPTE